MTKNEEKPEEAELRLFPEDVPNWIKEGLERGEDVIAIMGTGLYKGRFAETSLVLTNKRVMVYKKRDILEAISLTRIEEASIRTYLNVCILVIKTGGVFKGIAAFNRNRFKSLEKLVTIINNLVIGKISYELLKSSVTKESRLSEKRIFRRLFGLLRPTLPLIIVSLILSMVLRIFDLTPPYLIKILVDEVLTPRAHIEKLYWILAALLALFIGQILLNVVKGYINTKLNLLISRIMRSAIFKKLQRTSLFYHDKFGSGGLFTRIFDDARQIQDFIANSLQSVAINAGAVVFVGAILVSLSLKLTIISILPLFITFIMAIFYSMRAPLYYFRVWRKWSNLVSTVSDALNAVLLLKSYRKEREYEEKFTKEHIGFEESQIASFKIEQTFWPPVWLVFLGCNLSIWFLGGLDVLNGVLSLGSLIAFTTYMWEFYGPIFGLIESFASFQRVKVSIERVFELLDLEEEKSGTYRAPIRGNVVFDNVWFTYDGIHYVLKNVSLDIKSGERVGIVGPSGAGKTTMAKLMLRLYEPQFGKIAVDGVDLKEYDLESLRRQVAMVMQDTPLFDISIAENITIAKPEVSPLEVMRVAKLAAAHDFIMKLPEAYDTEVGRRGAKLSGGEKARIALAAALLKDPRILILDEPTAMLDALTEDKVIEALERVTKYRTTLIIAHRLSTLKFTDRIVVLDDGRVIETGAHKELLKKGGLYAELWNSQLKGLARRQVVLYER